jgi:FKBP-type peptidyl-prolyl cis-trans isomerase
MRSFLYLALLGACLLTLALVVRSGILASKHFDEPLSAAMRSALAAESPQMSSEDAAIVRRDFPTAYATQSGLMYINTAPGAGTRPAPGQTAVVRCSLRLLDGRPIGDPGSKGLPVTVRIPSPTLLKGVNEALLTMGRGGRRTLIVPYWLAYGEAGLAPSVPPRATLVADVELVDIR